MRIAFSPCFCLAFAIGVASGACAAGRPPGIAVSAQQMQALGIQTQPLRAGPPAAHARLPARVILPPGSERVIASPLAGVVAQIFVQQDQTVKAGAPLMRLAGQELGEQQLKLLQAAPRFELARKALRRDGQLVEEGVLPARRAQEARAAYAESEAALQQAKAALRLLGMSAAAIEGVIASGKPADSLVLAAPHAGVLARVAVKPGERVEASTPLVHLAQVDALWLEVQVPAGSAGKWPPGTRLRVAGTSLGARIVSASPLVAAESQTVVLRAAIDAPHPGLRPGEMVAAELPASVEPASGEAWEVPLAAVTHDGNQAYVFVRTAEGFEARPVAVLASAGQTVQVQGRLQAGEQMAVSGIAALKAAWLQGKAGK